MGLLDVFKNKKRKEEEERLEQQRLEQERLWEEFNKSLNRNTGSQSTSSSYDSASEQSLGIEDKLDAAFKNYNSTLDSIVLKEAQEVKKEIFETEKFNHQSGTIEGDGVSIQSPNENEFQAYFDEWNEDEEAKVDLEEKKFWEHVDEVSREIWLNLQDISLSRINKIKHDVREIAELYKTYIDSQYDYSSGLIEASNEMLVLFCSLPRNDERRDSIRANIINYMQQNSSLKSSRR